MKSQISKLNYPLLEINQIHFHRNGPQTPYWAIILDHHINSINKTKLIVTFSINYDKNGDFINIDKDNCRALNTEDIFQSLNGGYYADKLNQMILEKNLRLEEDPF
jgi:hypothetical protein